MEEHNKKTLIEALSSLPEHEPNDLLWQQIEAGVEGDLAEVLPAQLIQSLQQHEPPDFIWGRISQELGAGNPDAKFVKLAWLKPLAIAASLALVMVVYWQLSKPTTLDMNVVAVNFSEETVDPLLLEHDWDEDENVFTEFLSLCEGKKVVCEQPEFQLLQSELDELTAAKEELKTAIGEFSTDAELVIQIKEIELERTEILKKMMVMLI